MKTLQEYLELPYKMELIPDTEEGGYVVSFPELPGCLTCADTIESAILQAEDAKKAWLEAAFWTVSVTDSEIFASAISTARQTRRN